MGKVAAVVVVVVVVVAAVVYHFGDGKVKYSKPCLKRPLKHNTKNTFSTRFCLFCNYVCLSVCKLSFFLSKISRQLLDLGF